MIRFFMFFIIVCGSIFAIDQERIRDEREWLKNTYLPSLEGRVLFVGVNYYNVDYVRYAKCPELYETIDFLPERAQFGSPYRHHVGDFLSFDPGYQYDHICLFGVMGHYRGENYNIDTDDDISLALNHAHTLLKIGGTLQVGPNVVCVPTQNTKFWMEKLNEAPLDKYEILLKTRVSSNILWWGIKSEK